MVLFVVVFDCLSLSLYLSFHIVQSSKGKHINRNEVVKGE